MDGWSRNESLVGQPEKRTGSGGIGMLWFEHAAGGSTFVMRILVSWILPVEIMIFEYEDADCETQPYMQDSGIF